MDNNYTKGALVAGWVVALAAIAIATDVSRSASWFAFAVVGVVPAFVLLRLWPAPAQAISRPSNLPRR